MNNNGIKVISYLLNLISPIHKSTELITGFYELLTSDAIFPEVRDQIYYSIILNIKLWIYSPLSVQQRLFDILNELYETNIQKFMTICHIPYFLDILSRYYYYELDIPSEDRLTLYNVLYI